MGSRMNILKILIESVKIYCSNKLFWMLGLGIALLTFVAGFDVPSQNEGLQCLFFPVQFAFSIISILIATSLVILTFNHKQLTSAPYSEVWKEARSKFFFRLIGASFLYIMVILVFIIIYLLLNRLYDSSLLFNLLTLVFWAIFSSQIQFVNAGIIIDDFGVSKATWRGIILPIRHFFFVVNLAILLRLVNIGITFAFVYIFNALSITDQIAISESYFYSSYSLLLGATPVRLFTIFTSTFLTPIQTIAFTLAYLKLTPRIVKPEIISPFEQGSTIEPV